MPQHLYYARDFRPLTLSLTFCLLTNIFLSRFLQFVLPTTVERQKGWVHVPSSRELQEREAQYGRDIVAWLRRVFPEWNRDDGNRTHSAAIAEVIRLHWRYGKHDFTKREHGAAIRAAVTAWQDKWERQEN